MAAHALRLKLRMFLEGVEVPIVGVQLQCLPNAPILAAIQVPPVPEGTRLKPRTLVHVFFLDPYEEESQLLSGSLAGTTTKSMDPSSYQKVMNQAESEVNGAPGSTVDDLTRYKLFFGGEFLGFEWSKDQGQRALILQCADWSNYWDYAYQWTNTDLFGPGIKAMFSGGSTNLFTDFLSSSAEVITTILRTPSITFPKLKGLAGGIVHLLESIGGSYYYDKKIAGQNIFFTLAELRLHINQMIMAIEDDPTASRLLALQGYTSMMSRLLGGMGGQTSIRQSITALQGIIFHETYAQPCPKYIPGVDGTVSGQVRKKLEQDPGTVFIVRNATTVSAELSAIIQQLHVADDRPDVSLLSTAGSVQSNLRGQIILRLKRQQQFLNSTIMQLRKVRPAVPSASSMLNTAVQKIGIAATKAAKWTANNPKSISDVETPLTDAISNLNRVANLTVVTNSSKNRQPARLAQQILRPDVWFSAPPRCNVIFPEHYSRLSYRRSFMEEPTRLLLKTNDEFFGEDELFDRFYFAPKTSSVKKSKVNLQALLTNDLLEHELFTGILPVFEKMGELNIFAARGGVVNDRVPQVGLAQRSANFLYFKYRFAARQMTVSGRFNPYIAVGFPGLVLDKYVDVDTLNLYNELLQKAGKPTRDINKLLGTSFLGNFTQVTYMVNQSSGSMDIVMSYPRQPDEGVEYLGATDKEETTISRRFNEDVTRVTDVATIGQPSIESLGPNLGRITNVEEVSSLYRGNPNAASAQDALSSKPLLLFSSQTGKKPRSPSDRKRARVPVGIEVDARTLDKTVLRELGLLQSGNGAAASSQETSFFTQPRPVTIRAYRLQEEVPRYYQETVDLPAEEYIRPGWYGDIWHPAKIGQAYDTFFSTGAITDPHTINDPSGAQSSAMGNDAQDAIASSGETDDPNDPRSTAPVAYQLAAGASIEQAAAFLQATYSHIKQSGLDVEQFIRSYTWRPIATLIDMFGTTDLQLSPDGQYIVQGIEGFHSRAFGPYNDLFGLVTAELEEVVGLKRGTTAAQKGDTRKVKQDAVKDYLAGLGIGRAILG
jgi:hypothetical protein